MHSLIMGTNANREQHRIENNYYDKFGVKHCSACLQNAKPRNPFKLLYYCAFVCLCALLVLQVQNTVARYLTKPTYTSSRLVRQYHAAFPALSICDRSRGFKEDILKVFFYKCFRIICRGSN